MKAGSRLSTLNSYMSAGGKAVNNGATSINDLSKEQFVSLFSIAGSLGGIDIYQVFRSFGANSKEVQEARKIEAKTIDLTRKFNEQFRKKLAQRFPKEANLAELGLITSSNASAVYDLLKGN